MSEQDQQITPTSRKVRAPVIFAVFVILIGFLVVIGLSLQRAQSGPIRVGQTVPPFQLTSFDGETIDTSSLLGKVLVVNFWASWCTPCADEAEALELVHQHYKDSGEVMLIGVDYVDTEPEALAFIAQYGQTYFNAPDMRTSVSQMFRIQGVPETYIIDREGKLAFVRKGPFASEAELMQQIEMVLQK